MRGYVRGPTQRVAWGPTKGGKFHTTLSIYDPFHKTRTPDELKWIEKNTPG